MSSAIGELQPSFIVNSDNRLNPTNTNVENFDIEIPLPAGNKFNKVSISSVMIPKSFYNIGDRGGDETFTITEPDSGAGIGLTGTGLPITITLPAGDYNYDNLPLELERLINASTTVWTYTVTFPDISLVADSNRLTFTVSGNDGQPTLTFTGGANNIYRVLGFNTTDTNVFVGDSLVSTNVCNFELTKYIIIKSNISLDSGNMSGDNAVLAVIPVLQQVNGAVINYELVNLEDEGKVFSNNGANRYIFSLHDDNDNELFLNGRGWGVKLFIYEYNPFFELAIQDMRVRQLDILNNRR